MSEKHILISLGDSRVKEIGEVIGSKSCAKILDLLSEKDLTVSDISGKLKMPINTVDYNVKKLVKSGLIEKVSHFWSVKGKRMSTYRVSDKKIVISPRKSMANVFVWTIGLTGAAAIIIRQFTRQTVLQSVNLMRDDAVFGAIPKMESVIESGAGELAMSASSSNFLFNVSPWSWFLFGAWFAVLVFFIFCMLKSERRNKK